MVKALYFLAIMLTAIALGAGLAHLFELPNKIGLSADDYLTVQRNDNWWIVGLVVPLAFLSALALTIALRATGAPFALALIALLLLDWRSAPS
jgi:amino acid permease